MSKWVCIHILHIKATSSIKSISADVAFLSWFKQINLVEPKKATTLYTRPPNATAMLNMDQVNLSMSLARTQMHAHTYTDCATDYTSNWFWKHVENMFRSDGGNAGM